jgi:hypothetical protein
MTETDDGKGASFQQQHKALHACFCGVVLRLKSGNLRQRITSRTARGAFFLRE